MADDLPFKTPVVIPYTSTLPEFNNFDPGVISSPSEGGMNAEEEKAFLMEVGQDFVEGGFVPIPLVGKRPITRGWQNITLNNAMRNLENSSGYNNLGLLTGKSGGITVVDIDNSETVKGSEYFERILKEAGIKYPDTYTVATGGGGTHLYFNYVGDKLLSAPLRDGSTRFHIDIKNDGGQVVAPGSIHPDTRKEYSISNNHPIIDMSPSLLSVIYKYQH